MNFRLERFHMLGWSEEKIEKTFDMFADILRQDYDIMLEMTRSSGLSRDMSKVFEEIGKRQSREVKFEIVLHFKSVGNDDAITILRIVPLINREVDEE